MKHKINNAYEVIEAFTNPKMWVCEPGTPEGQASFAVKYLTRVANGKSFKNMLLCFCS